MTGEELKKFKKWEALSNTERHMILMYLYRVETEDFENLEYFIETHRFREYGIKRSELPTWFLSLPAEKLKSAAYDAIGRRIE